MTLSPRAVEAAAIKLDPDAFMQDEHGCYIVLDVVRRKNALFNASIAIKAALAVDGLCLVPKEPTMAMLYAAERAWIDDPLKRSSTLYRAMLAAANDGEDRR